MAAVTVCKDFGAQENKIWHCFHFFPIYLPWSDGTGCHDFCLWMLSFKPAFSCSSSTFIKRLFSSFSLSAIRVVSSAYLNLLIFLQVVLIPASASSSLGFHMIYSSHKGKRMPFFETGMKTDLFIIQFSSVQFIRSVMSDSLRPQESQHTRPPCPSPTPGVHSDSCPSSQWCHPAISSSVVPFSSCPHSLPASETSPVSQLFAWGGQSTGVSALASFHHYLTLYYIAIYLFIFLSSQFKFHESMKLPFHICLPNI